MEVWSELKSLGLDMTFVLESLMDKYLSEDLETAPSPEPERTAPEALKGLGLQIS